MVRADPQRLALRFCLNNATYRRARRQSFVTTPATVASPKQGVITIADQLVKAVGNTHEPAIVVRSQLDDPPSCRLAPGQSLSGVDDNTAIRFAAGIDGLKISSDNEVSGLTLNASVDRRAIFDDTRVESPGRMHLKDLTASGQVQILARCGARWSCRRNRRPRCARLQRLHRNCRPGRV